MKRLYFAFISCLVCLLVVAAPARTQPPEYKQLPKGLNIALCVNNWNQASNILDELLRSPNSLSVSRQQLVELQTQVINNQRQNRKIDQQEACAAVIEPSTGGGTGVVSPAIPKQQNHQDTTGFQSSRLCTTEGKCFQNTTAKKRHLRSVSEGDR